MINYYCLHHSPATERKHYLTDLFNRQNLQIQWIEDFLPDCDDIINYPKVYCVHAAKNGILNNAEISLCLKHNLVLKKIGELNNEYGMIFEDDIKEPSWSINEYIPEIIKQFEEINGEILWIGSDPSMEIHTKDKIKILSNSQTKSRFSHCYLIHSSIAKKVLNFYCNIMAPPDWQWNFTIDYFKLKSCWCYPSIFQRTSIKEIPSLLRDN